MNQAMNQFEAGSNLFDTATSSLSPAAIDPAAVYPSPLRAEPIAPVSEDDSAPFESFDAAATDADAAKAVIACYFEQLNAGEFQAAAALFAADGVLYPPFDSAVMGPEAIEHYLHTEAKGLQLFPSHCRRKPLADGAIEYHVGGKVQTALFGVNVGWTFVLNAAAEILSVRVKLLASLEELLKLKS
jgi:hypothetical protein